MKIYNGKEYTSQEFNSYGTKHGIQRQLLKPETLHHNKIVEQKNCIVLDIIYYFFSK